VHRSARHHRTRLVTALATTLIALATCGLAGAEDGAAQPAERAPTPPSYSAEYQLGNGALDIGRTDMALKKLGEHWRFVSETRATGVMKLLMEGKVRERSDFALGAQGIRLLSYAFRDENKSRRDASAEVDWAAGKLDYRYRGRGGSLPLEGIDSLHDRLSSSIAVMLALVDGRLRENGEALQLSVFDGDEIKPMRFAVAGRESIDTPRGEVEALRVERLRANDRRRTLTWYAPSLDYVPVRIEQHKDGKLVVRMSLHKLATGVD